MSLKDRRNVAFIGHSGVGKTPICEAIVKTAGATDRIGKTSEGSSHFDFEPEEEKRDATLKTSVFDFTYKNTPFSIFDTPGSSSFLCDTACALRGAGSALLVSSGISGIKIQGKKAWMLAREEGLACGVIVKDIGVENASIETAIKSIKASTSRTPVPIQLPMKEEDKVTGIIDLINMKAYLQPDSENLYDIPEKYLEEAKEARNNLLESIAETDEDLLGEFLESGDLSKDAIKTGLQNAIIKREIFPLLCFSPRTNHGTIPLLIALYEYFPSPFKRTPYLVQENEDKEFLPIEPSENDDFIGIVYKTFADPFTGQVSLIRVISGTLKAEDSVYNPRTKLEQRVGKLSVQLGKDHKPVTEVKPGEIAAITKLKDTLTGDTLTSKTRPRIAKPINFPTGGMRFAVEAKKRGEEDKVFSALEKIHLEDPSITVEREPSTRETIVTCMGQQHMDITAQRIKRKFNVELSLKTPKVPYRETIKKRSEAQGKHKKQSGGRGQFGDCWLRISPRERGEEFKFNNEIFGGAIPKNYIPAVEKGVVETMEKGVLAGFPIVDIECSVYDGSYHSVDSSDMAFKIAAAKGFRKAVENAKPVLLEPIMKAEIVVPDDTTGDIIGDLNSRRGKVLNMEPDADMQVITAEVPLAEMLTYTPSLRSMTSDRGFFNLEFKSYEEVPALETKKIIEEYKKSEEGA